MSGRLSTRGIAMGPSTGTQAERSTRKTEAPALVSVAPANHGGTRDDILAAMAAAVVDQNPASTAEALRTLRSAYPDHPLALRLAALAIAMKRTPTGEGIEFAGLDRS
jgi:hypothetical protein